MKRLSFLVLTLLVIAASAVSAIELPQFVYTGQLCDEFDPTQLCAKFVDGNGMSGIPIVFLGKTLYGQQFTAGPVYTDALGKACAYVNWAPGLYEVTASIYQGELSTPPVALSIFTCNQPGFYAGGAVFLKPIWPYLQDFHECAYCPNWPKQGPDSCCRRATFGLRILFPYGSTTMKSSSFLYLDPNDPFGAVRITSKGLKCNYYAPMPVNGKSNGIGFTFTGFATFEKAGQEPITKWVELKLKPYYTLIGESDFQFCLTVFDHYVDPIYKASGYVKDGCLDFCLRDSQ